MKYGTVTEQWMRKCRSEPFDFKQLFRTLTVFGWLQVTPDNLLEEISETLARIDTETKFFTFKSFNNMGKSTYLKLTDPDYT
jgi:hypothetical protein